MPEHGARSYPPVGDPDRLDSIVQRGRSLRRRRQLGVAAAGTGGTLAVVGLVAVAVLALGGGSDTDDGLVADDATTTTVTTTTAVPPATMTVGLVAGPPAQIRVEDPHQPMGEGTQQCLTVAVYDPATTAEDGAMPVAEGTMCAPGLSAGGTADLALVLTTSSESGTDSPVEIGCAAAVTRPADGAIAGTETRPGVTTFTVSAPELVPGTYRVVVSAVSGIGDGCAPEQPGLEREHVAEADQTLALP